MTAPFDGRRGETLIRTKPRKRKDVVGSAVLKDMKAFGGGRMVLGLKKGGGNVIWKSPKTLKL